MNLLIYIIIKIHKTELSVFPQFIPPTVLPSAVMATSSFQFWCRVVSDTWCSLKANVQPIRKSYWFIPWNRAIIWLFLPSQLLLPWNNGHCYCTNKITTTSCFLPSLYDRQIDPLKYKTNHLLAENPLMTYYLIQNLIQSSYNGLPVPIWSTPSSHLSDFISKSSLHIVTPASLMFFKHTKIPHLSVFILSAPFRTSPFLNARINLLSLSSGHCSNAVLSVIAHPDLRLLLSVALQALLFLHGTYHHLAQCRFTWLFVDYLFPDWM